MIPKIIVILILLTFVSVSKDKIAVLPFINADGDLTKQIWSYDLQDSLYRALLLADSNSEFYEIISVDDVENTLAELNIDPTSPEYKSDMWKACKQLGVKTVVTGNYNFESDRFLINCYIYNVKFKLALPEPQAKNIFKSEENIYESINEIVKILIPGLKKN